MTAPAVPDLLDSVLAAFPEELELTGHEPDGFALKIKAPGIRGLLFADTREGITLAARMYERMRCDMRSAVPLCAECGDSRTSHDMGSKRKPCGRYGCQCSGWKPAEKVPAGPRLSAEGEQDIAAMNARTYAMSPEDRDRWFAEHPAATFGESMRDG